MTWHILGIKKIRKLVRKINISGHGILLFVLPFRPLISICLSSGFKQCSDFDMLQNKTWSFTVYHVRFSCISSRLFGFWGVINGKDTLLIYREREKLSLWIFYTDYQIFRTLSKKLKTSYISFIKTYWFKI